MVKAESGDGGEPMYGVEPTIKPELGIKAEPVVKEEPEDIYEGTRSPAGSVDARKLHQMTLEPALVREQDYATAEPLSVEVRQTTSELLTVKPEPIVKLEPLWED